MKNTDENSSFDKENYKDFIKDYSPGDFESEFGEYDNISEENYNPEKHHQKVMEKRIEEAIDNTYKEKGSMTPKKQHGKQNMKKKRKTPRGTTSGAIRGGVYILLVFGVSIFLAIYIVLGSLDLTGLGKSETKVTFEVTQDEVNDLKEISKILKDKGIIDRPELFRLYCKVSKKEGKFVAKEQIDLSPDMGYEGVVNALMDSKREIVKLTFPEGYTAEKMGEMLEENRVCSKEDFIKAVNKEYPIYSFVNEIPTGGDYDKRVYKLEGYLFPDQYEFYVESSAEAVVTKFLDNFKERVSTAFIAEIKTKGYTLDEVIIAASLIEWEAGLAEDRTKVARVITNRLKSEDLKKLQFDSTWRYIREVRDAKKNDKAILNENYDTYVIDGLPIGPINNPGFEAIKAVVNPSEDDNVINALYFASDTKTKVTYFSNTYEEHVAVCERYGIGIHGAGGGSTGKK